MKREIPLEQAHRLLAPRVTCLLTTQYHGHVNVMALSWTCPISLVPPLVIMAIQPSSYTHDMLKRSQECVLNIPGRPLAEQTVRCGTLSGADADKIQVVGLGLESGHRVQVPWIESCLAHLECGIVDVMMPGDHGLFIGEILGAWAEEEAFGGVWLGPEDNEELQPLLHLGGNQFSLLGKKVIVP